MNLLQSIVLLLVGAAVFIIGMNMMSSGLKKSTGSGLKRLLKKIQNKKFACFGIGAAITALIQSSAATSVMTIGFINAGAMTIAQGVCIILGAYVGTTATGLIVSLSAFSFSSFLILFAVIGVILMFIKNEKCKNIGEILAGLGLLFFGLQSMSSAFSGCEQLLNATSTFFGNVNFPFLLLLIGALFTALIQSSSATSGIVIVMVGNAALSLQNGFYLVLGATIGTVITTIIATIGSNVNAKRTAIICLIIRTLAALLATGLVWIFEEPLTSFFLTVFKTNGLAIAMFLLIYNIIFMLLLLPFTNWFEKLSIKLIEDKNADKMKQSLKYIDNLLLNTPTIAVMQVKKEIISMMQLSYDNFIKGYKRIIYQNNEDDKNIIDAEEKIDYINNEITLFLINLTHKVSETDEKIVGSYFHVINDIERIGDHAFNFYESSIKMMDDELKFSDTAIAEFNSMYEIIIKMFDLSLKIFDDNNKQYLNELHQLEDQTDKLKLTLSAQHFERITNGKCHVELSPFYSTLLSELERVADHLVNIGYSIVNPTGDTED